MNSRAVPLRPCRQTVKTVRWHWTETLLNSPSMWCRRCASSSEGVSRHSAASAWSARESPRSQAALGPPRFPESEELSLDGSEVAAFSGFWALFCSAYADVTLAAVIRRFSYAGERIRADDEIVDLIAALESPSLGGHGR
jgi:hypothetical protein